MKKIITVALILAGSAAAVQAQSNVTVYGLVDLGLVKSSGQTVAEVDNYSSRLGFLGTEDLGGGLSAFFNLESDIAPDTGALKSVLFSRQAHVGLKGSFGSVYLGRTKNIVDGAQNRYEPFYTYGVVGSANERLMRLNVSSSRVNNAITYKSPDLSGFAVSGQYVLSEVSGASAGFDILVTYDQGPLSLHAGYERTVQTAAGPAKPNLYVIAGGYKFGPAKITAAYAKGDTQTAARGKYTGYLIGLRVAVGVGEIQASAARQEQTTSTVSDLATIKLYGVGYSYPLSKRTSLYGILGSERVTAVTSYQLGITHKF